MKFKNRPNKIVWDSRSVAVVGVIMLYKDQVPYILVSKRGPSCPDFVGKMNLVAGYLDWDENGSEALIREAWEETGFDVTEYLDKFKIIYSNINDPWSVNTEPDGNRQNISLRYGLALSLPENTEFPLLTTIYNEIEGESEDPMWLSINDIDKYDWAFNHDRVIYSYNMFLTCQLSKDFFTTQ